MSSVFIQSAVHQPKSTGEKASHRKNCCLYPSSVEGNCPPGPPGPRVAGATYVRWGRTSCPTEQGTQLLYAGRAAGPLHSHQGGGANLLCLPDIPDYLHTVYTVQNHAPLCGVEYHLRPVKPSVYDHNIPCAVCYTPTRATTVMIPAWTHCPASWAKEYTGYLGTDHRDNYRLQFECFDKDPELVEGEARDVNGVLVHLFEATCNTGLNCPPYHAGKELTCAVCTKWTL